MPGYLLLAWALIVLGVLILSGWLLWTAAWSGARALTGWRKNRLARVRTGIWSDLVRGTAGLLTGSGILLFCLHEQDPMLVVLGAVFILIATLRLTAGIRRYTRLRSAELRRQFSGGARQDGST